MQCVKFTPNELDAIKPLEQWDSSYKVEGQTSEGAVPFCNAASLSHKEEMGLSPSILKHLPKSRGGITAEGFKPHPPFFQILILENGIPGSRLTQVMGRTQGELSSNVAPGKKDEEWVG
ncbi:hypothetical protein P7K49_018426 [Saguinus oedipus]|uniref:Uncharacterized protein n=1 Tax=Saguinus oedipus TaxID=9490 RepID=A0ABQ9V5H3_SAGOE|nr:hypothetical protein P7K49_018426 [Saguinus oedipus]